MTDELNDDFEFEPSSETRTYRGSSLEELLPQIREELGPDAIVTRRREGVHGGVAGFFGRKLVEVEAQAAPAQASAPAVPARAIVDAYDTGEPAQPRRAAFEDFGTPSLVEELIGQAAPFAQQLTGEAFAGHLASALEREAPLERRQSLLIPELTEEDVRAALARAAVPPDLVREVIEEATAHLTPFAPDDPLAAHVRRALARRFRVRHRGRAGRRRIALVGPPGAGRTLATAKLCGAYRRTGAEVCALSLESATEAFELATVTRPFEVQLEVAQTPAEAEIVRRRVAATTLVVADTPAFDPDDAASGKRLGALLAALRPTETHLVLPAGASADRLRVILAALRDAVRIDTILLTRADTDAAPTPLGVALRERLPVSYVSAGPLAAAAIRPAEPGDLAALVLP